MSYWYVRRSYLAPLFFFSCCSITLSLSLALARTRTTRSFSPFLFNVFHPRRAFPFPMYVKRDAWEEKQMIQLLNGYLGSSPLCCRAGRTYAHFIIYEESVKEKGILLQFYIHARGRGYKSKRHRARQQHTDRFMQIARPILDIHKNMREHLWQS